MHIDLALSLYLLGGALALAYFTLFVRTVKAQPSAERARFLSGDRPNRVWLSALLVVAVFFVDGFEARLSLAVLSEAWTLWGSRQQYASWLQQGFDPGFVARLRRVDVLSHVGVLLVFSGAIAEVWPAR